ncbi:MULTISPECIES: hypothetical protein [unclassified Sphingomonas]|uniref:hypothetical protein n=1 Tax=unclassified Sphingomonas TaxID=196159 RepID=UPI002859382E|nr:MULTISPECIES: hypothetical protein [unclassified Sphingomonas]MDR6116693.1 hypothetical protein [Sphingomonas sp. SORGH_AS_0789]MDR6149629.1 hypothetical protein [Sphingomonas sp. SORGH_AS_0742]
MTSRRTENFPHRSRPRQRRQASRLPALPQGGLLTTLTIQQQIAARFEGHRYEAAQLDAEQALLLANVAPAHEGD